ncbi:MAG: PilZ domain-containing protein [Acidobacteria bacterium]|nr:PilZ domain-containing protein [Acidobacteriota bacterium]
MHAEVEGHSDTSVDTSAEAGPDSGVLSDEDGIELDAHGTRRATRVKIEEGIEVLVDGKVATLLDLSVVGALIISTTVLRPNQRVRFSLPDPDRTIRISASVAWATMELTREGPRYRAGVEFFDADSELLRQFCDQHRRDDE